MATIDPAVRSVQIARALADRLGTLFQGPNAVITRGSFGGDSPAADELALRIGEAQQIAPEIWRHLDEARDAIAGRGVDVSAYDEIRRSANAGTLATSNIEAATSLDVGGLARGNLGMAETKVVEWNVENLAAARAAIAALAATLPEVDWDALDRADQAQIAAAGSLHRGRWTSIAKVIAAAVVLVVIGLVIKQLVVAPEAERARAKADERDAAFARHAEKIYELEAALAAELRNKRCDRATADKLIAYLMSVGKRERVAEIEAAMVECNRDAAAPPPGEDRP